MIKLDLTRSQIQKNILRQTTERETNYKTSDKQSFDESWLQELVEVRRADSDLQESELPRLLVEYFHLWKYRKQKLREKQMTS